MDTSPEGRNIFHFLPDFSLSIQHISPSFFNDVVTPVLQYSWFDVSNTFNAVLKIFVHTGWNYITFCFWVCNSIWLLQRLVAIKSNWLRHSNRPPSNLSLLGAYQFNSLSFSSIAWLWSCVCRKYTLKISSNQLYTSSNLQVVCLCMCVRAFSNLTFTSWSSIAQVFSANIFISRCMKSFSPGFSFLSLFLGT